MDTDKRFYVTTPIYYVNSKPHVGTSYTSVIADIACRFARMNGVDARLVTGSDEHSQNIVDLATAAGKTPRQFCDEMVPAFHAVLQALDIQQYAFYRTSDPEHHHLVQRFWQRIYDNGDVYKGEYSGWYHTSDNRFLDEDEVPENPEAHPRLKYLSEEAYWFKLSKYENWLLAFHEANPTYVIPDFRRNEMLNRIRGGLKDVCISRTSTDWGVLLPWDSGHVIYVWVDALLTYLIGSGFDIDAFEASRGADGRAAGVADPLWENQRSALTSQPASNYWPCDLHFMAVDIPWFHAVIWPAMLASFGAPPPRQMLVHGYWIFGGEKMSKSLGNVVDPFEAISMVGVDGLRYFYARERPLVMDGNFSHEALLNRFNYDLANDLGNLVHRTVSMLHQLFDGSLPEELAVGSLDEELEVKRRSTIDRVLAHYSALEYSEALQALWELIAAANKYIDERKPWELKKKPERRDEVSTVFYRLAQVLRTVLLLAYPVIPGGANRFWQILGLSGRLEDLRVEDLREGIPAGHVFNQSAPVYQRLEAARAVEAPPAAQPVPGAAAEAADAEYISIDDFSKVELRVGEVRQAERVENADKLLKLTVFDGERERQILAGVAQYYAPEELVGKQVVFVANLAPRKMRGLISEGMILAAGGDSGSLSLVAPAAAVEAGSRVK
jgi:methionyl-tRNA synthetase